MPSKRSGSAIGNSSNDPSFTPCPVCCMKHAFIINRAVCPFCNGTGEYSKAAVSFLKYHPCWCDRWGGQFCPVCTKKCHHSPSLAKRIATTMK